jgi:SAM-dependent methyltransferase
VYWESEHGHRAYDHPVVRFFAMQRLDYIRQFLDLQQVHTALDVGCGNGFSTFYMHNYVPHIWAVDRSYHMLIRHPFKQAGRAILADAFTLPFPDKTFDLVYGWEVLHHIVDPTVVVAEMARVSRRYILVAEPNRSNLAQCAFALMDREHRLVLHYNRAFLRHVFTAAGLTVQHLSSGGWIFPNVTPQWLLPILGRLPYRWPFGITHWILGVRE